MGNPMFRPRTGSDRLVHGGWGSQPSGPLLNMRTPAKAPIVMGMPAGPGAGPFGLPSRGALDYVHTLTQTSLLIVGVAAFLVLHRGRGRAAVRKIAGKVA